MLLLVVHVGYPCGSGHLSPIDDHTRAGRRERTDQSRQLAWAEALSNNVSFTTLRARRYLECENSSAADNCRAYSPPPRKQGGVSIKGGRDAMADAKTGDRKKMRGFAAMS